MNAPPPVPAPPATGWRHWAGRTAGRRFLRGALLGLALCGLFYLYYVKHDPGRPVRIGALLPSQTGLLVRVQGRAAGDGLVQRAGGRITGLQFVVDDGSGQLPVIVGAAQAQTLAKWDRVPRAGDRVTAAGRLALEPDRRLVLRLLDGERLRLTRRAAPPVAPAATPGH